MRLSATVFGVASWRIIGVRKVYLNGVEQTSGWTLELRAWKSGLGFHTTITFSSAPADDAVVTADVDGCGLDEITLNTWTENVLISSIQIPSNWGMQFDGSNRAYVSGASSVIGTGNFTQEIRFYLPDVTTKQVLHSYGDAYFYVLNGSFRYVTGGGWVTACNVNANTWTTVKVGLRGTGAPYISKDGVTTTHLASSGDHTATGIDTYLRVGSDRSDANKILSGGKIDFLRTRKAFENTPGALVSPEHKWEMSQNGNDSVGSMHLTVPAGLTFPVIDYTTEDTYADRLFATWLTAQLDQATGNQLTWVKKFRLIDGDPAVSGEKIWVGYLSQRFSLRYDPATAEWLLAVYGSTGTATYSATGPALANTIEHELVVSLDIESGEYLVRLDREDLLRVSSGSNYSGWAAGTPTLAINHRYDGSGVSAFKSWAIDFEAVALASVFSRRNPMPRDGELKYFWDFQGAGTLTDVLQAKTFSVSAKRLDGSTGTSSNPQNGYSYTNRVNHPAEDFREILHLLGEPVSPDLTAELDGVFSALGFNTAGQSGGCVPAAIGGTESGRSVIQRWCQSHDAAPFVDLDGRWGARSVNFDVSPTQIIRHFNEATEILRDGFSISLNTEIRNECTVRWKRRYKEDKEADSSFEEVAGAGIADSISRHGRSIKGDDLELDFVRGNAMAETVTASRLRKLASRCATVSLGLPLVGLPVELGDVIKVTHGEGPAADGQGWRGVECVVRAIGLNRSGTGVQVEAIERALDGGAWFNREAPAPPPGGGGDYEEITITVGCARDTFCSESSPNSAYGNYNNLDHGQYSASDRRRAGMFFGLGTGAGFQSGDEVTEAWLSVSGFSWKSGSAAQIGLALLLTDVQDSFTWNAWDGHPWAENNITSIVGSTSGAAGNKTWSIDATGRQHIQDNILADVSFSFEKLTSGVFSLDSINSGSGPVLTVKVKRAI